jgi:hypothetical protein
MNSRALAEVHRRLLFGYIAISSQHPEMMIEVFNVPDKEVEIVLVNGCVVGVVHRANFKVRLAGFEDTMNVRRNEIKDMNIYP